MKAKSLLIPIAAFAVTATGVSAFNSEVLEKAGLTEEQISAFEEARELRQEGDRKAARDVLLAAGVDLETMENVKEAMHEHKEAMRTAIDEAVDNNDFDAFKEAVAGSPLEEIITSETDFELFVEAHNLRAEGDRKAAQEIMEELGFAGKMHGMHGRHGKGERDREGEGGHGQFPGFHGDNGEQD